MKKIILFLIVNLFFIECSALTYNGCDYSTVSKMKSMIKNVNITYDYKIIDNEAYFDITINNLTNDIYFYDVLTGRNYYYSDTNNGEITIYNYKSTTGSFRFYSNVGECYGVSLGNKYYNLPVYNRYYGHSLCADIPNFGLCKKWGYVSYSEDEFKELVSDYINGNGDIEEDKPIIIHEKSFFDKLVEGYIKYYYYVLGALILICSIVIIVNNKKNSFKL